MNWQSGLGFVLQRLREPSTYAGLAAVAAAFGVKINAGEWSSLVGAAMALAGVAAVLLPERGKPAA